MEDRFAYGLNPKKLGAVSAYLCDPASAPAEFLLTKSQYQAETGRAVERGALFFQIRQAFPPGEVTPEEANKIGYETAMRWTKGKYQFFVCTHIDKGHIHNHIYYNSTAFDRSRKFHNFIGSSFAVRRLSDRVCIEHELSVIQNPKQHSKPCAMKHMTPWAAEIDCQSYNNDVLYIQAAGNVYSDVIGAYWQAGYPYPIYLERELCRISDPAQSLQALTVGSVSDSDFETEDIVALGKSGSVSSFSRSGPGIWDVLKPEVVEYGGTHAYNKGSNPPILLTPPEVCPELIRKSPQGPAFARDAIGTSFAAPKVTYIASQIEKTLPQAPALLYRALIAQSARWPRKISDLTKDDCVSMLRHIGYGIPDVHRATSNDEYRITLITPVLMELGDDEAHIFQIPIPEELSSVGEDYDILVEITLSYAANPRRTRRDIKGYLSTWLDWCCSRIGENAETFAQRIFETGTSIEDDGNFDWVLGEATNRGLADGYSRKKGTLQKDWCVIKSNQLSDAFCVAVRGHKGWGGLFKAKYSLAVSFEAINQDIPIYEPIRTEIEATIENQEIEVEMPDSK